MLLGGLVSLVRKIRANDTATAIDGVAGAAAFLLDKIFGFVNGIGSGSLPIVTVAVIAVRLHHHSPVAYRIGRAYVLAEQRMLPIPEVGCMGGIQIGRIALAAMTTRAAIRFDRMVREDSAIVRTEGFGCILKALP